MEFDEAGNAYIYSDEATVSADTVIIEYTEETEYTNNQILMQINSNICDGFALMSGLIGLLIGILCAKELLKIWLK